MRSQASINKKFSSWRVLAVEDGGFKSEEFKRKGKAFLVGTLVEGFRIKEVLLSRIVVDGLDATDCLLEVVEEKKEMLDIIMLASISYAGFNLIDPVEVHNRLNIPVLIVNPKKPSYLAVESALKRHFSDWEKRLNIIRKAGKPYSLRMDLGNYVYFFPFGISVEESKKLMKSLTVFGNRPEPLRIARLIAHGLGLVVKKT